MRTLPILRRRRDDLTNGFSGTLSSPPSIRSRKASTSKFKTFSLSASIGAMPPTFRFFFAVPLLKNDIIRALRFSSFSSACRFFSSSSCFFFCFSCSFSWFFLFLASSLSLAASAFFCVFSSSLRFLSCNFSSSCRSFSRCLSASSSALFLSFCSLASLRSRAFSSSRSNLRTFSSASLTLATSFSPAAAEPPIAEGLDAAPFCIHAEALSTAAIRLTMAL
mmetsp:Transcript_36781/g.88655  ORF Transcript_36781/g.88655 Transcript_36781/m.88655 type:complete len:221 (-) Transcript_36781:717-1379(-)